MKTSGLLLLSSVASVALAAVDPKAVPATMVEGITEEEVDGFDESPEYEPPSFFSGPTIKIIWEKDLTTGKSVTTVWDSTLSKLHAYGCGDSATLDTMNISVSADEEGDGNLQIGPDTYTTDFRLEDSGGISCFRTYNDVHAVTECTASAEKLAHLSMPELERNSTVECFGEGPVEDELASVRLAEPDEELEDEDGPGFSEAEDSTGGLVERRSICGNPTRCQGGAIEDGYCCRSFRLRYREHRKFRRHVTLLKAQCTTGACYFERNAKVTHNARFYPGIEGKPGLTHRSGEWTAGGLRMKRSHSGSNTKRCGGKKGESVCLKNYYRYQQYWLNTAYYRDIYEHLVTGDYRLRTPLSASGQSVWYCVNNNCPDPGHVRWEDRGSGLHGDA